MVTRAETGVNESRKMARKKQCPRCKKRKDESQFGRNRSRRDGLSLWCKKCAGEYRRWYYSTDGRHTRPYRKYEQSHRIVEGAKQKLCPKCKKWKDESGFSKNQARRDGLSDSCRKCERERVRKYSRADGRRVKKHYRYEESHRIVEGVKEKRCRKCRTWKAESEFYKHRRNKDGLDVWCRECANKAQKRRLRAKK
jgi:hypothetical protein